MANCIDWRTMQKPWCQPGVWQKCLGETSAPIGVEEIVEATNALRVEGRLLRLKQPKLQVRQKRTRVQMSCSGEQLVSHVSLCSLLIDSCLNVMPCPSVQMVWVCLHRGVPLHTRAVRA